MRAHEGEPERARRRRRRRVRAAGRASLLRVGRLRGSRHVRSAARGARACGASGVLPRHSAQPVRRRGVESRAIGIGDAGAADRGEAVRPRPGVGAGPQRHLARVVSRGRDLPHRPLPGQGAGAESAVLPLCQHVPRTDLERSLRRQRADHHGRGLRRPRTWPLLRRGRRAARRLPESPAAGAVAADDGAAVIE